MSINEPITQENVAQAPSTPPMDLPDISPAPAPASSPNKAITQIASEIENTSLVDHEADAEAEPAIVHKIKLCGVCDAKEARYKCVRCYLPYCSMDCSVAHKATHALDGPLPAPIIPEPTPQPKAVIPRAGTTGFKSPFSVLDDSKELQALFLQFPDLRKHLNSVHRATLRPVEDYGQQKSGRKQPWNEDQGMMKGVEALHRAKGKYGKDGEGVREYGRLVLQLLEKESEGGAQAVIRKEIEDESARIIRQLIEMER